MTRARLRAGAVIVGVLTGLFGAGSARAAPPWVARHLTLPSGDWAFDAGLGVAHVRSDAVVGVAVPGGVVARTPGLDETAAGVNVDMAVGLSSQVELGVRTGLRPGSVFDRLWRADEFGRLFDRQTFGTGVDVVANPEVRVRGAAVRTRVVELALEGRVVLPFEPGTDAGVLVGMPLAFHLGGRVRLDTGVYLPVVFSHPTTSLSVSAPLDVWIQATPRLWLGPMTGFVARVQGPPAIGTGTDISLGFGLGYSITHYLDLKAMVLFPAVNRSDPLVFGFGGGIEVRIE